MLFLLNTYLQPIISVSKALPLQQLPMPHMLVSDDEFYICCILHAIFKVQALTIGIE
jgi:hypothetical protein